MLSVVVLLGLRLCAASSDDDDAIAVDCSMSRWDSWGSCDDEGKQWRTRRIMVPPRFGGKPCEHLMSSRACVHQVKRANKKKKKKKNHAKSAPGMDTSWMRTSVQPPSCHMTHPRWHFCYRHGGCCSDKICVKNCDFSIYNSVNAASSPTSKAAPTTPLPTPIPNPEHLPAWALKLQHGGLHAGARTPSPTPESAKHRLERLTDMNYRSGSKTDIKEGDYVILAPPISLEMAKGPLKADQVGVVDLVDSELGANKDGVKVSYSHATPFPCPGAHLFSRYLCACCPHPR